MPPKVTLQSLAQSLELLLANQVTKEHFDNKIKALEKRIDDQETKVSKIDTRLVKLENESAELPNNIYKEMHEQEIRTLLYLALMNKM